PAPGPPEPTFVANSFPKGTLIGRSPENNGVEAVILPTSWPSWSAPPGLTPTAVLPVLTCGRVTLFIAPPPPVSFAMFVTPFSPSPGFSVGARDCGYLLWYVMATSATLSRAWPRHHCSLVAVGCDYSRRHRPHAWCRIGYRACFSLLCSLD